MPDTIVRVDDYLEKLELLEEYVGETTQYSCLEPFGFDSHDLWEIQEAASKIASFMGMGSFVFLIEIMDQPFTYTGHRRFAFIDLTPDGEQVIIHIQRDAMDHPEALLATLAHEISHKFLAVRGVSCGWGSSYEYHNEVLTDIAAIFLGAGKLLLNGCESTQTVPCRDAFGREANETRSIQVGYLTRPQLAFVYRFVAAMRAIPPEQYMAAVSQPALDAIADSSLKYEHYFSDEFHQSKLFKNLESDLTSAIREAQLLLARVERGVLYAERHMVVPLRARIAGDHARLAAIEQDERQRLEPGTHDPALRYLRAVRASHQVADAIRRTDAIASEVRDFVDLAESVASLTRDIPRLDSVEPDHPCEDIVCCPRDGAKLRVPAGQKRLIVACTQCGYRFATSTSDPEFDGSGDAEASDRGVRGRVSLWRRLLKS